MILRIEDTQLHYEIEGEGVPVFIIHGNNVDYRLMYGCLEPCFVKENKYKRIYIDIPGLGESIPGKSIKSWIGLRDALIQAIEHLIGSEKFIMIGESFGAHLLRSILQERVEQVIGVMFICPWIPDIEQKLPQRSIIIKEEEFLSTLDGEELEKFHYMAVAETEDAYIRFARDILPGIKLYDEKYIDELESNIIIDRNQIYEEPTLFVLGRQDHVAGYEAAFKLLEQYPRATYSVLDSCGHNAQIERVDLFEVLVQDWLKRINYEQRKTS